MNDKFRSISKKVAWPCLDVPDGFEENHKKCQSGQADVPAGLPTRPLWNRSVAEGCAHPRRQVVLMTKFGNVEPNICGSLVWNLLVVTILEPRILKWLLDFWKI